MYGHWLVFDGKQASHAHACSEAHARQQQLSVPTSALADAGHDLTNASAAEGMTERYGSSTRIQLGPI